MSAKRGGLGTNLDALIPTSLTVGGNEVAQQNEVSVDSISPNPKQPRTVFNEEAMAELVASIKEIGILQPPVVRQTSPGRSKQSLKTFTAANSIHLKKQLRTHNYFKILNAHMTSLHKNLVALAHLFQTQCVYLTCQQVFKAEWHQESSARAMHAHSLD